MAGGRDQVRRAARRMIGVMITVAIGVLLAARVAAPTPARAQAQPTPAKAANPEFYRGKTINLIVGFSVGGGFDLYARTLARHLPRYIPGAPTVIVQNMPGAGSLKSVDYLFAVAPRDGTMLSTFSHTVPIEPLIGHAGFDTRQLAWIGSMANETSVCVSWHGAAVKTWDDLRRLPFTVGGTGRGSDTDMAAKIFGRVFGLPLRLVTGYPGTSEMILATERGEIDGFCGIFHSTLTTRHADWLAAGRINIVLQAGLQRDASLPDVPNVLDAGVLDDTPDARRRRILMLLIAPQAMARPFAMPPGSPPDRVAIIRRAFAATLVDPEFAADARAARIEISPVDAARIEALLADLYATPPDILREAKAALEQ